MKRSPLQRKTHLKRGKPPRRVGRLKARSAKRRREDKAINDLAEFADLFIGGPCWFCPNIATDIDHMLGRNSQLRHHRCNLAASCRKCHEAKVLTFDTIKRLRHLKQERDPVGFDAEVWSELVRSFNGTRI